VSEATRGLTESPPAARRVRTPILLQMEAVECGAASLGIILWYYGRFVPLEELRVACGVSRDGAKANNIVIAARQFGLEAQGYRYDTDDLRQQVAPCILFWNFNHFLVLEGFGSDRVFLNDPRSGRRSVSLTEFGQSYTGVTLAFRPGSAFKAGGTPPSVLNSLKHRGRGAGAALVFLALASILLVVPELFLPGVIRIFVDRCLSSGRGAWLLPVTVGLVVTALVMATLTWLQQAYLLRLETQFALRSSAEFFWHVLRLPLTFFSQRYSGEIGLRVGRNDRIAELLSGQFANIVLSAVSAASFALVMLWMEPTLAAIAISFGVLNVLALRAVARTRQGTHQRLQSERARLFSTAVGGLQMIESLKASGGEGELFTRWAGHQANYVEAQQQLSATTQYLLAISPNLRMLSTVMILLVGGLKLMDGALSVGSLVAFQILTLLFSRPLDQLVAIGGHWNEAATDMQSLDDVLQSPPQFDPDQEASFSGSPSELSGRLAISGVTFGYTRLSRPLIEGFECALKPGGRVAIVGETGCGKSTIARLVTGLLQPWDGQVLLDGHPLPSLPRTLITRSVAMVDETHFLFAGTVRDNLTFWNPLVSEADLTDAARDACILHEILARPGGLDSMVTEGGSNFSVGQRQRLQIARSLARNPALLVLDEATSALDSVVEQQIDRNLRRRGCSCLIIAHRLSTVRDCDEILVLEQGRVVQRGIHEELVSAPGPYANLVKSAADDSLSTTGEADGPASDTVGAAESAAGGAGTPHLDLARELARAGLASSGGGNRPVPLTGGTGWWVVRDGGAEVFACDRQTGRRQFLYSVPAEGLVASAPEDAEGESLILVGQDGSLVVEIPMSHYHEVQAIPEYQPLLAACLDHWFTELHRGLRALGRAAGSVHSGALSQVLGPGEANVNAGSVIRIDVPVLWVRAERGTVHLQGDAELELPAGVDIPISSETWLNITVNSLLHLSDTLAITRRNAAAKGARALQGLLARRAAQASALRRSLAPADLARQLDLDRQLLAVAHRDLATVLSGEAQEPEDPAMDGALAVCRSLEPLLGVVMRKAPPTGRESQTPADSVREIARVSGVRVREVALTGDWWKSVSQPMVGFTASDVGRPIAVLPASDGCEIVDDTGHRAIDAAIAGTLQRHALAFYRPFPPRSLTGRDLWHFALVGCGRDVARITLTGLAVGTLAMALPLATGRIFGIVAPCGFRGELAQIALALGTIAIASALLQVAGNFALLRLETVVVASMQSAIWDRVLRLPASFFGRFPAGELASRAMGITAMIETLAGTGLRGLLAGVFSLCSFALLFWLEPRLATFAAVLFCLGLAIVLCCAVGLFSLERRVAEAQGTLSGIVLHLLTGLAHLRVSGAEARAFQRWSHLLGAQRRLRYSFRRLKNLVTTFSTTYPILATAALFWVYAGTTPNELPVALFLSYLVAFGQVFASLHAIASAIVPILGAYSHYERTRPILEAAPEESASRVHPGALKGAVAVRHLRFRYTPDGPLVLDDVSLHADPGEFIAIVGASGAGKSSLFRLLLGFETPTTGTVSYDGQDLGFLDAGALRHAIGVVLQNGQLARGTLLQTIVGTSSLTVDDAWEAARLAGIEEEIRAMPMEMMTYVSEGASTFSGGQKQRLLIARAIARRPSLLLLDEATSGLDNRSQEIVTRSLERLRATRIVIAHRLSTVARADRIYVLEGGKIVQSGKFEQLVSQVGPFRKLAQRQLC
jgi:NHLM bacteriocin system ABC transporter peptidase/ATP-binding protein/NHLM bacteriocin system ABC transporter ATP-binding protein